MDKVSIGLSVAKTWLLSSNSRRQDSLVSDYKGALAANGSVAQNIPLSTTNPTIKETSDKREYPYQVSLGGAWFPSPNLLLSADVSYFTPVSFYNTEILANDSRKSVVNFAVGSEYYLDKTWAVRTGVYSSMANTSAIKTGSVNQPENIDLYGGSLTLTRFTRNTSISGGASFNYGSGKAQIRGATDIQDVTFNSWTIFVTSAYSF
jgi:long-chain fatty acid transport protein